MKYRKIILSSFFAGSIIALLSLIMIRQQQPQPAQRPNHGDDMVGLAYGLAIAFNIIMAIGSLPALLVPGKALHKAWVNALLLLGLPLAFTFYSSMKLDAFALFYCVPYLLVAAYLLVIRIKRYKRL